MGHRLPLKIVVVLVAVVGVTMSAFTAYIVQVQTSTLEEDLLARGRIEAISGARTMEKVLADALRSGRFTAEELFDTSYRRIPDTDPPKYHTVYDAYLDETIRPLQDAYLKDPQTVFAVLVDRNGYLPTHNAVFSRPLTGDREKDRLQNRTKRLFNDGVGLAAAQNRGETLKQDYHRDTGEHMWDISAPVLVEGRHWGAFRIGMSMAGTDARVAELRRNIILSALAILALSGLAILVAVRVLLRPLLALTRSARRIAEGNYQEQIPRSGDDEIGMLADAFNRMTSVIIGNLHEEEEKSGRFLASIREAASRLAGSASRLSAISNQQSTGASQQATAVQQVTTTSEEVAVTARQISESAGTVERVSEEAERTCQASRLEVGEAIEGMERLKGQVRGIAGSIEMLGEHSLRIGGIVEIIDEISDQTNLLALNAAIEAAGAGEAGKRFSIVAREVRRLAERTVDATRQIRDLVEEIQKATGSSVTTAGEGLAAVEVAGELVEKVQRSFARIVEMVEETSSSAREITWSTRQQTTACEQMAATMAEVRDVTLQVADGARNTEAAVEELRGLTESMKELMEEEIRSKGMVEAVAGAKMMEKVLTGAVESGRFTLEQIFDEEYVPVPGTSPKKYHTSYDGYLDERILSLEDEFLEKDAMVVFAVLVDRNGYLPTHNSKYSQPLTGDPDVDRMWNRTKRIFDDKVGLAAARNAGEVLVQAYFRDTGEKMWDLSAPVYVQGKHWGAFRIGYTM